MHIIGRKESVYIRNGSTPTGLVWNSNMAAVSLFWNTNMAAVTSCEKAHVGTRYQVPGPCQAKSDIELFADNSTPNNSALMLTDFCVRKMKALFSRTQKIVKFKSTT